MKAMLTIAIFISACAVYLFYDPDDLDNHENFPNRDSAWEVAPVCQYAITHAPSGWAAWFAFRIEEAVYTWKWITGQPTDMKSTMEALEGLKPHELPPTALLGQKSFCLHINEIRN